MLKYNPVSGEFDDTGNGIQNTDPLLSSTQEIRVKLNPGVGEFSSIATALASITTSSDTERYVIRVYPGTYTEPELDMTTKPYVSIVGSSIQTVVVQPDGSHPTFRLGVYNELSYLWLEGTPGEIAVLVEDSGDYSQMHKCTFNNCSTGIKITSVTQDTKFYGEYLDFNGAFEVAVLVQSSNSFVAYANLENFYVFPLDPIFTNGVVVTGATALVDILSAGFKGINTGSGITLADGATVVTNSVYIDNFDIGLEVTNLGIGSTVKSAATQFSDNVSLDISLAHINSVMTFIGSATNSKVYSASPNFSHGYSDPTTGIYEISNQLSVTFDDGTHTDLSTLVFEASPMGLLSGGVLSDGGGLDVNVTSGFGYLDDGTIIKRMDWIGSTITLTGDTDNFIYINSAGILSAAGTRPSTESNILLGRVYTFTSTIAFIDNSASIAHHSTNKQDIFNRDALGSIVQDGILVSEGTALKLDVTSGTYFRSSNRFTPSGGTDITFLQFNHNGSSAWVTSSTTTVNNSQYNNGNTLSSLTAGFYTKHSLYMVGDGVNEKYFLVLGQIQNATLLATQGDAIPTPPTYLDRGVILVALVYVQQGNGNIVLIEDARPVIGFKPITVTGVTSHGALSGLSADDHTQYLLVDGSRNMAGAINMAGNNITSIGTLNGVTIETHASRHLPNNADPLDTAAPSVNLSGTSTNATGIANSFSRSDHSHAISVATSGITGLLSSTDWTTFNNKQAALVSGTNIKTLEGQSLLGAGNIDLTKADVGLSNVVNLDTSFTANITDTTNKRFVTDAQLVVVSNTSGTNTGDQTITLTGDATGTGTGSFAVTVSKLNGTLLSGLATGILKNTTGTGIPSIAVAGDFPTLNQNTTGTASAWTTGRTISATGDVTYTSGTLTGAANVTGAATIANAAVTFAKMQDIATQTLLGRSTAGTGSTEALTLGTGLTLAAGVLSSAPVITSVNAAGDITTTSAADVLATTMTLTPGAGTYLVLFSSDMVHSASAGIMQISIYANNALATNSKRTYNQGTNNAGGVTRGIVYTQAIVTVAAAQTIEARWNRGAAGTGIMGNRSLILIKQ